MPANWTDPVTWVDLDLVTAADLNEQVRDNLLWLKGRNYASARDYAASFNTTSTSFVAITGASATLNCTGGRVLVIGYISGGGADARTTLYVDGVNVGGASNGIFGNGHQPYGPYPIFYITPTAPTPGNHTFALYAKGSGTYSTSVFAYSLFAFEFGG